MSENRFTLEKEKLKGMSTGALVITDEETGVQYLFVSQGYAGGLTVLVDAEGKPLLDPRMRRERF